LIKKKEKEKEKEKGKGKKQSNYFLLPRVLSLVAGSGEASWFPFMETGTCFLM